MLVDSTSSCGDFFSEDTVAEGLKAFDKCGVEWHGRGILQAKDARRIHSVLANSLGYKYAGKDFSTALNGRENKHKPLSFSRICNAPSFAPPPSYVPYIVSIPTYHGPSHVPLPIAPPPLPPPVPHQVKVFVPTTPQQHHYNPPPIVPPTQHHLLSHVQPPSVQNTKINPPAPPSVPTPTFVPTSPSPATFAANNPPPPAIESLIHSAVAQPTVAHHPLPSGVPTPNLLHTPVSPPITVPSQKQSIVNTPKGTPSADFMQSFLVGVKSGAVDSVKEVPSTIFTIVKMAGTYVLDPLVNPLSHILPGQEFVSQAIAIQESVSYLQTCDKAELAKTVAPEMYKLVTEWDNLSQDERAKLSGYCVGKYGTDILLPVAAAKGVKAAVNLAKVEAGVGAVLKEAGVVGKIEEEAGAIGNKIGVFNAGIGSPVENEIAQIKAVALETPNTKGLKNIVHDEATLASIKKFENAKEFLKPYKGQCLPEAQIKELIHQSGVPTFPRPAGIPENFKITLSDKGAGLKYVHPNNEGTYIRVMPGKPHSPNPYQQKPYVTQVKDGKVLDKSGNIVDRKSPEAHIPIDEFIYKNN